MHLGLFLYLQLKRLANLGRAEAAEVAGMLVGKFDMTIRGGITFSKMVVSFLKPRRENTKDLVLFGLVNPQTRKP